MKLHGSPRLNPRVEPSCANASAKPDGRSKTPRSQPAVPSERAIAGSNDSTPATPWTTDPPHPTAYPAEHRPTSSLRSSSCGGCGSPALASTPSSTSQSQRCAPC